MMERRSFLRGVAGAALGLSVGLSPARGENEPYEGPLLAVFNAEGGWDTTYLMDPKGGPALNQGYQRDQIQEIGAHRFAPTAGLIAEGAMSNRSFFERYGESLLVINGIDTSVNNHSPCARYLATGELSSRVYPTLPALAAAALRPELPLAFMTFGGYANTGNLVAQTRIPYLRSLERLGNIGYSDPQRTRRFLHERASEQIREALAEVNQREHELPKVARARRAVLRAQESSRSLERLPAFLPEERPDDLYRQQLEIALSGFAAGLSVSANFKLGGFDSHDTNDADQLRLIPQYLAGVDYFIRRAGELGLTDRLVIVLQSEMGRTPWYNESGGKDHWSVTSMMLLGAGIQGDRVVGMTSVDPDSGFDQSPAELNPRTLQIDRGGIRVRPEHIHEALRAHLGVDDHPLAARFALRVPREERLRELLGG